MSEDGPGSGQADLTPVLERTFVHVRGVGRHTEARLWSAGATDWAAFLAEPCRLSPSSTLTPRLVEVIMQSQQSLLEGDHAFFARTLSAGEQWRSFGAFPGRTGYLDIETTGDGDDEITVIGLYDGVRVRQFVRGENLLDFPEALEELSLLVTFYGSGFDLPVLRRTFPRARWDQLHIDLCHVFRRLNVSGGLKVIEGLYGIRRSPETDGLNGWDAVRLWYAWQRGSEEALRLLLAYNAEDVVNLEPLARAAYQGMQSKLLHAAGAAA